MIYTITFNPSLDYIIQVDHFQTGTINKTTSETILPGGKGINVSIVLANLHHPSCAFGFLAGFTGEEIEKRLHDYGCNSAFIKVKQGLSRINIKMKSDEESEINGSGPIISNAELDQLWEHLKNVQEDDIVVISGSIPACLPDDMYEKIMALLQDKNVKIVVDATKNLLLNVLKYHPFLIKPNHHELSEIFGVELKSKADVIPYAHKLKALGACNVLVSLAEQGAILLDEHNVLHQCDAPSGKVVNSVGAGDSMVAGFLSGYIETNNYEYALKKGICSGSASAFSTYLAHEEDVLTLLHSMK